MKAINIDGAIKFYSKLPKTWRNYLNFSQAHEYVLKAEGFYDVVEPEYDPMYQRLGEIYFDQANELFTYPVLQIEYNLDELLQRRLDEFDEFQKEFRRDITELYLEEIALGVLPEAVKQLIGVLTQRRNEIIAELKSFRDNNNLQSLLNFSFYTAETEAFKQALRDYKVL